MENPSWAASPVYASEGDSAPSAYCVEREPDQTISVVSEEGDGGVTYQYAAFTLEQAELVADILNINVIRATLGDHKTERN